MPAKPISAPLLDILHARPAPGDHAPGYAPYLAQVSWDRDPEASPARDLRRQPRALTDQLLGLDAVGRGTYRYAPEKWSIREIVGHLVEVERVMAYRLLRAARLDPTPLPGFDEDQWVATADHDARPLVSHLAEFSATREATLALLEGLPAEAAERAVEASGHRVTVRALVWILHGHVQHHAQVLADRYGVPLAPLRSDLSE